MAAPRTPGWDAAQRVLAVRLDNLGDLLMTTPALAALKAARPGRHLAVLTSASGAALAPHLPWVDEWLVQAPSWMPQGRDCDADDDQRLIERLRDGRYDAAVVFTVCTQSALPAALALRLGGVPLRLAHSRENPYGLLTDWVREPDTDWATVRHEVRRQLDLVAAVGCRSGDDRLRFTLRRADEAAIERRLATLPDQPLVLVQPGATAASRRWPAERFGALADALVRSRGATVVFAGSPDERPLVAEARAAMRCESLDWSGALSLGELAALIARADLLVGNNSGPAHLAAALGTPTVVLYALTNPQHTPWMAQAQVLSHPVDCRHCLRSVCPEGHHHCLTRVSVEQALQAALDLLPDDDHRAAAPMTEARSLA
ncbi:lipopolysaccharide heptosyltransferase II [Aquabacterium sp. J223]|uniref:lipopolysaccharide heptosyltransferase II n=1 Tax=Aquabacterium sp. J223 TaxID=2898431 RepID=UPI0021ADD10A|nr:lipopolysaccharide heptosyltransferase II [Aquabacterium sp. J223]UUX94183.1 lipopolysaccharide heptosyltransferase II [Aquabacterium sp. J223]